MWGALEWGKPLAELAAAGFAPAPYDLVIASDVRYLRQCLCLVTPLRSWLLLCAFHCLSWPQHHGKDSVSAL